MVDTLIYGIHSVAAQLRRVPERVLRIQFDIRRREDQRIAKLLQQAQTLQLYCEPVSAATLDKLTGRAAHQGIAAAIKAAPRLGERDIGGMLARHERALWLVLDGVQDPQNLGACLRAAAAAGVDAVMVPGHGASPLTPAARKVASGAADIVPLVEVGNLARALQILAEHGVWRVGMSEHADSSLYETDLTSPLAIVLGAEESGLRRLTREHCDQLARIPTTGTLSSLNVAVAAGVCLFEANRQRRIF